MEILKDFKFWLFILSIAQIGIMSYGFIIIKFNDLKHLGKDVSDIQIDLKEVNSKVINIDKNLAVQKQRIDDLEKSTK